MSSSRNKLTVRQSSLICESPKTEPRRRNSLRRQNSEDNSIRKNYLNNELRASANSKCKIEKTDFPKPKLAWGELEPKEKQEPIIGKKCQENRKSTRPFIRQSSIEHDSILSSKEGLIDKLRLLLRDDKQTSEKSNINIFLAHNSKPDVEENILYDTKSSKPVKIEEKIGLEGPMMKFNSDCNSATGLFQFRKSVNKNIEDKRYYPSTFQDNRREPPNILLTPMVDTSLQDNSNGVVKSGIKNIITDNSQPINNIIIRPTTAASKRDLFKKRTNSAFHSVAVKEENNQRAPLQRSSSAPIRPDHAKSKFLATKRKLKNTRKKDLKSLKKGSCEIKDANEKEIVTPEQYTSTNGTEIVTMVSLVSPAASDVEEISEIEKEETKSKHSNSPKKHLPNSKYEHSVPKILPIRKIVKQVSFQQSSIHTLRSFSAGFGGRRNSVVTSLMLGGGGNLKRANTLLNTQEKRVTSVTSVPDDDERVPKRRLLRSRSAHLQPVRTEDKEDTDRSITPLPEDRPSKISINIEMKLPGDMEERVDDTERNNGDLIEGISKSEKEDTEDHESGYPRTQDGQKFSTPQEKECWNLYLKMNNKGVKVNYDTLLRGMLTPTQYRTRRQSLADIAASLTNDVEKSTENETP